MSHRELLDRVRAEIFGIQEAKEGDLFRHLRKAISDEYSIPHNQIETAVSVGAMVDGVYADHSDKIHEKHLGGRGSKADGAFSNEEGRYAGDLPMGAMEEARGKFEEFVTDTHKRYINRGS